MFVLSQEVVTATGVPEYASPVARCVFVSLSDHTCICICSSVRPFHSFSACCCCCRLTRKEGVQIWLLREAIRPPHWAHVLWPVCISTPSSGVSGVIVLSCIVIRPTLPSELAIILDGTSSNPLEPHPDGRSSNLRLKDLPRARLEPATQWVTSGLPTTVLLPAPPRRSSWMASGFRGRKA